MDSRTTLHLLQDRATADSENALATGLLGLINGWYAIAKIAGIKLACVTPSARGQLHIRSADKPLRTGANFDLAGSHVLSALIREAQEAKLARARASLLSGTGTPHRDLQQVDGLADARVFRMQRYSPAEHVNVGYGKDVAIADQAWLRDREVHRRDQARFGQARTHAARAGERSEAGRAPPAAADRAERRDRAGLPQLSEPGQRGGVGAAR